MPVDPLLFDRLDAMGEDAVRDQFVRGLSGVAGSEHHTAVMHWLKAKDDAKAVARADAALSLTESSAASSARAAVAAERQADAAADAAKSAQRQSRWAAWAAVIATIAAIIAASDKIERMLSQLAN